MYSSESCRTAILTDGHTWDIFHIDEELHLYRSQFYCDTKANRLRILSTLPQISDIVLTL